MKQQKDISKDNKAMLKKTRKKSGIAFLIVMAIALILILRVIFINVISGEEYSQKVLNSQTYSKTEIKSRRGSICDRNGTVLAYSKKVYNLIIDPLEINNNSEDKDTTIAALVQDFGLTEEAINDKLKNKPSSRYEKMAELITQEKADEFNAKMEDNGKIVGVWFEDSYQRVYPFSTFACDTIGFYNENSGGVTGLERYYDDELTGTDGLKYTYIDSNMETKSEIKAAENGNSIITTIDYGAQNIIDTCLSEYNAAGASANTGAILMDPNSGEVLAMSSWPTFDLNNPYDLSTAYTTEQIAAMNDDQKSEALSQLWRNYCVSSVYEPGSTFKSIVVAGALEEGLTHDGETFYCGGSIEIADYVIRCWTASASAGSHGSLDLEKGLGDSCNMVLIELGTRLGAATLEKYQSIFGIGSKTGIDLPAEERGILQDSENMSEVDIATNSFGQNFNTTMIQMAAAYCSLVNGGTYYQPHVVKEIRNSNGETVKTIDSVKVRQTVTKETSDLIRQYLKRAVDEYAACGTKIDGYSIGGKTGTAEKIPRSEKKWLISVVVFAPVEDPKFVLYVVIDEAKGTTGTSGSGTDSTELCKSILNQLLPYYGIQKEETDDESNEGEEESGSDSDLTESDEITNYDYEDDDSSNNDVEYYTDEEDGE